MSPNNLKHSNSYALNMLISHPFIFWLLGCLISNFGLFICEKLSLSVNRTNEIVYLFLFTIIYILSILVIGKGLFKRKVLAWGSIILCLLMYVLFIVNKYTLNSSKYFSLLMIMSLFLLFLFILYIQVSDSLYEEKTSVLLLFSSFLLKLGYILYTPYYINQHDSGYIGEGSGHIGYIEYFIKNNFHIPNFDPRSVWQFYHPPLHHIISAAWVKINIMLGMEYTYAIESIQILTLFYSGCAVILCYKIFKELDFKKLAVIVPFAISCFHPSLIFLSGSINNDVLCLALTLGAIYNTIVWYKESNLINILKIAFCIAFAMLSKSSGALVAPAIAAIFLIRLIQLKGKRIKLLIQFIVFGIISLPIGVSWIVYNFAKYKMPLSYVPSIGDLQYIGNYSLEERLFGSNLYILNSPFMSFDGKTIDYNIIISLLKTSIFDEYNLVMFNPSLYLSSKILFIVNVLLIIISVACMIVSLLKKSSHMDYGLKIFFSTIYLVLFGSFLKFCFEYPNVCTQSFRYIVILFILGTIAIGDVLSKVQNMKMTNIKTLIICLISTITVMFCVLSAYIYSLYSYKII